MTDWPRLAQLLAGCRPGVPHPEACAAFDGFVAQNAREAPAQRADEWPAFMAAFKARQTKGALPSPPVTAPTPPPHHSDDTGDEP